MENKKFVKENGIKMIVAAVIVFFAVAGINFAQDSISILHQNGASMQMLEKISETLDSNASTAQELSDTYHTGNREILNDLKQMMQENSSSSAISTTSTNSSKKASSTIVVNGSDRLDGLIDEDFAPYLFLVDSQGNVSISADKNLVGHNLCTDQFITKQELEQILKCQDVGVLCNPYQENANYYFYATSMDPTSPGTYLVVGFDNDMFEDRIASLTSMTAVVNDANLANGQAIFTIDPNDGAVTFCSNSDFSFSGKKASSIGIPDALLSDGGTATMTINGTEYLCVSLAHSDDTILVMAVSSDTRLADNYKPTVWAVVILVMALILAVLYVLSLPRDLTKKNKKQKIVRVLNTKAVVNLTAVAKALPLVVLGLVLVFGSTFYCRTILKLSWAMDDVERPLSHLATELAATEQTQADVKDYCDQMYLSQAQMIANMIEVNPSCLNESTTKVYEQYSSAGTKQILTDSEGNPLKSVPNSEQLQQLCSTNSVSMIQIYNDEGYLIADSAETWNFQLSHDSEDQSSEFYDVILGKVDYLVQDPQEDDLGNYNQYIGVAFNYYTTKGSDGSTLYVSRLDYQSYLDGNWTGNPITAHQSVLQCAADMSIRKDMMESLDISYIMENIALQNNAYMVVFDNSSDHNLVYSPNTQNIGKTAEELGVNSDEFSGSFNGFQTVQGVEYYECCRYSGGYYVAIATPTDSLYSARLQSSLLVTLAALIATFLIMLMFSITTKENMVWLQTDAGESDLKVVGSPTEPKRKLLAKWRSDFVRKPAEEKITTVIRIFSMFIGIYFLLGLSFGGLLFADNGVINYILSDTWERGANIFAFTKGFLVLVAVIVCVEILNWFVHRVCTVFSPNAVTIVNLLMSLVRYVSVIAALFYCLYLFGMDAMSLLVSAGLLTLIIGLGAQSLISDMLASVFIIFEGYYHVGDYIKIGKTPGVVTEIGIRSTRVKNIDNSIAIYNNSEIKEVVNMSVKDYLLKLRFCIAGNESLERVEKILRQELPSWTKRIPQLVKRPSYNGVVKLGTYKVEMLVVFTCKGIDYRKVLHAVNREFKLLYEKYDIKAPYELEVVANGGSLEELHNMDMDTVVPEDKDLAAGFSEAEAGAPEK